jgi:alkylhydroperoxidase/carboxymuconolactone decarboxylase family protein YurZ
MGEYENALEGVKKTMGTVLDQFTAIPHDALAPEWAEMKRFVFSETKIPAKYRELMGLAVASANIDFERFKKQFAQVEDYLSKQMKD